MLSDNIKEGFAKRAQAAGMTPEAAANLYKQANPIWQAMKNAGKFTANNPWQASKRLLYGGIGTGLVAGPVETILRTELQQTPGTPTEIKQPTISGGIQGAALNSVGNAWGVNQALNYTGKNMAEGYLGAPATTDIVNKLVEGSKNVNEFSKSPAVADTAATVRSVSGLADKAMSKDPHQRAASFEGIAGFFKSMVSGGLKGMGESMVSNPYSLPLLIGSGTLPFVAYDLLTKKKREERALLDKALLTHLQQQSQLKKKADITKISHPLSRLFTALKKPVTGDMIENFFHHTTKPITNFAVPLTSTQKAQNAWSYLRGKPVPPPLHFPTPGSMSHADLKKVVDNHPLGQSLLNNSFSRNLGRTGLATSTLLGGYGGAKYLNNSLEEISNFTPEQRASTDPGMKALADTITGVGQGVVAPLKAFELAVVKDKANKLNPAVPEAVSSGWAETKNNLTEAGQNFVALTKPGKEPVVAPKSNQPTPDINWKPYAGVAAGIGVPYAVYKLYQMMHEKKLNKLDKQNKELKEQLL